MAQANSRERKRTRKEECKECGFTERVNDEGLRKEREEDEKEKAETCRHCRDMKDDDEGLQCDGCGLWFHRECEKKEEGMLWFCEGCKPKVRKNLDEMKNMKNLEMKKELLTVKKRQ